MADCQGFLTFATTDKGIVVIRAEEVAALEVPDPRTLPGGRQEKR
jgi:hypothetical protein